MSGAVAWKEPPQGTIQVSIYPSIHLSKMVLGPIKTMRNDGKEWELC